MCEIKDFTEQEILYSEELLIKKLKENGNKTYQIELNCAELEFIKDVLMGINTWTEHVSGIFNSQHQFDRGLENIFPDDLAEKIFKQFCDEDGNYR